MTAPAATLMLAMRCTMTREPYSSSRLYSLAIARLTPLTMVETGLPSFSNCSAQY